METLIPVSGRQNVTLGTRLAGKPRPTAQNGNQGAFTYLTICRPESRDGVKVLGDRFLRIAAADGGRSEGRFSAPDVNHYLRGWSGQ
ncbi:hypothetical protein [Tropicibacter sp. S64]|uniref:hypothetical protein n=1 Tax=Tropicibacter sp. S64 TaxID=3415122 RepID=UPI003C7DB034